MKSKEIRRALLYTILVASILSFTQVFKFSILELSSLKSVEKFGDLRLVLHWAECFSQFGDSVYQAFNPTVSCSGYIYGHLLLPILTLLNVSVQQTNVLGFAFLVSIAGTFTYLGYMGRKKNIFVLLIVLSPPIALLVDRANFDALVGLLILLSAIYFSRRYETISLVLIGISVLIKFYTLPLLILAILLSRSTRSKILGLTLLIVTGTLALIDINRIQTPFPNGYFAKFGFSVWGLYAQKLPSVENRDYLSHFATIVVALLVICTILKLRVKVAKLNWESGRLTHLQVLTIWYLTVHFSCFAVGMSYDYRLFFIIFASVGYLSASELIISTVEKYVISALLLLSCWLTFPVPFFAPIGDLALEGLTFWLLFRVMSPLFASVRRGDEVSLR
ncbi:MAG: hypothetical protein NTY85_06780 [Actinobacteria bacterium]|nr:hypothetical protein [Actinomycetota bacterium]